jgi:prepilin-type N-terminal cleavage/methylation domain-containing protein
MLPVVHKDGFTLIEFVLTLVIIAIVAAVAVPRFGQYYSGIKLESATTKVAADIRYAQNRATTTQDRSRFKFVNATNYEVLYCSDSTNNFNTSTCTCSSWTNAKDPFTQGDYQVDLTINFSGVTITALVGHCIEFDSLGRPYYNSNCNTDTSCNSSAGATTTLQYSGQSRNITMQTETGTVTF